MSRLTWEPNPSRETKLSGANGDRNVFSFPVQLTTSRMSTLPGGSILCYNMRWQNKYIYCSTRPIYPVLYNTGIQYALNEWPTTPRNRLHSCIFATTSEESCETGPTGHKRVHILKDTTVCIFYYRREADLFGTSGCCCCCCCGCCFPHSACCLPTRKTTLHGG